MVDQILYPLIIIAVFLQTYYIQYLYSIVDNVLKLCAFILKLPVSSFVGKRGQKEKKRSISCCRKLILMNSRLWQEEEEVQGKEQETQNAVQEFQGNF